MSYWGKALAGKRLTDSLITAGLLAGSFVAYLDTLAPSVATIFDDSLELQLVCYQPGIAHPTGYPLYTVLGKLFTFLPLGDAACRINLMSAFFGSLTIAFVYLTLRVMTKHRVPSILGATTFAASPVFWSQAVIAEVYTLNTTFMALILCLLVTWARTHERPLPQSSGIGSPTTLLSILALVYGLSLTHHRTIILLGPAAILFVFLVDRRVFTQRRRLLKLLVLIVAPLALYLYIPLRGTAMSSLDGVYQNTLRGFLTHITAGSYGIFLTENPMQQSRDLAFYLTILCAQFTFSGIAMGALGLGWLLKKPKVALLLVLSFVVIALFTIGYQAPDIEVFLIPIFLIYALWIGNGFAALWELCAALANRLAAGHSSHLRNGFHILVLLGGSLLPFHLWHTNRTENDLSSDWVVRDYGVDVLSQPLEQNAVVVGILGEMTLLNYFQQTEGLRPDLVTIPADTEEARLAAVRHQVHEGHAVYLTRPLSGVAKEYHLSSVGPLVRVRERPVAISDNPSHELSLRFGESILLSGYDAHLTGTHLGQSLRVTLYWKALADIKDEDYKVSVRLLDEEGHLGGVQDAFPVRDAYRTEDWRAGEIIIDSYDLPILAGMPPDDYTIHAAMYDPDTLSPLASSPLGTISLGSTVGLQRAGPWDVQEEAMVNLEGGLRLLGYSVIGQEFQPGETIPVTLLWQGLTDLPGDYHVIFWLEDHLGFKYGEKTSVLADHYPPANWDRMQVVRDWQSLLIPGSVNAGSYRLNMQVLSGDRALRRMYWLVPDGTVLNLGTVEVKGRERSFTAPPMAHPLEMRLGEKIRLLGYDLESSDAHPGGNMHVILYWQGLGLMDTSYTVFLHVLGADGSIWGQRDSIPGQGTLPTSGWADGEVIIDEYDIGIAAGAPPGPCTIALGMYDPDTGERLAVFDAEGNLLGDHISLMEVDVCLE